MEDHWFDELNKALVRDRPRRSLLSATALLTSLGLAAPFDAMTKKGHKGKGKGKGKHKDKGRGKKKDRNKDRKSKVTPLLCDPDILDACNRNFVVDSKLCEDTCEVCEKEGTPFCLVSLGSEERYPTCCNVAEECCGGPNGECCTSDRCCEWDGGGRCLQPGETCCPDGGNSYCDPGEGCCPGEGCFHCEPPYVLDLATCECVDPNEWCGQSCVDPGLECCDNGSFVACVDTTEGPNHCGGCFQACNRPRWCCDGVCADIRFDEAHCGFSCQACSPGQQCCHGRCIDSLWECCGDNDRGVGFCNAGTCCTLSDGTNGCYGPNGCVPFSF